jgi:hypothetical protein
MSASFPKHHKVDGAGFIRGLFFGGLAVKRQEDKMNMVKLNEQRKQESEQVVVDGKDKKMFLNFLQDGNSPISSELAASSLPLEAHSQSVNKLSGVKVNSVGSFKFGMQV